MALVRRAKRKVPFDNLCVAGGVALNCVTNEVITRSGEFSNLFIPSAPHDAGTAIGAAFAVHCAKQKRPPQRGYSTPYLGPAFKRADILAAVKSAGLKARRSKSPARDAADMIADGKIVAWFQGRMEFGPRALGNRSLLADPRRPEMRDILNQKVKHREDFRPFAPSVMAEHADEWFEVGAHSASHAFMLFAPDVKPEQRSRIPAVVHKDGTARVQLVSRKSNPRFHELLSAFFAQNRCPARRQHLVQRQRADRLHAHRRDRHVPQVRYRRAVHGRCGSGGAGLTALDVSGSCSWPLAAVSRQRALPRVDAEVAFQRKILNQGLFSRSLHISFGFAERGHRWTNGRRPNSSIPDHQDLHHRSHWRTGNRIHQFVGLYAHFGGGDLAAYDRGHEATTACSRPHSIFG